MKRLLREPLIHFLIGALGVFLFFEITGSQYTSSDDTIVVQPAQIERLMARWQESWRRVPSQQEKEALIDDLIRDEVLYREALRLGLDQDDSVVRNRMIQKMRFLQDDALLEPTLSDLQTWLDSNESKYRGSGRYTFEHRYLGQAVELELVELYLNKIRADEDSDIPLKPLFNLADSMSQLSQETISQRFGDEFSAALARLEPGKWHGPVISGFGVHLVKVSSVEQAESPTLEDPIIKQRVENDWRTEQRKQSHAQQYQQLRKRYSVIINN